MITWPKRSAWWLIAGIIAGFLFMSWQGRLASGYSKPDRFKRFHHRLGPDAYFYPTYDMLETLALARWQPGQVLVIIGGNSIMNGVGQPENELWSLRLQERLGDRYVVVNLALRGATSLEAAALVAESLAARGLPVVFVTNKAAGAPLPRPAEGRFKYFYWQAFSEGKVPPYAPREADLDQWWQALSPAAKTAQVELRISGWLEAHFHAQALWLHIGYRHFFTVYSSLVPEKPWAARSTLADNEPPAQPVAERFGRLDEEMPYVRSQTASISLPDATAGWIIPADHRAAVKARIDATIPPAFRPHLLMVLNHTGRFYLDHLTPDERARDTIVYRDLAQLWREQGIACVESGVDFEPADHTDSFHLSTSGGDKLAALVAGEIQRMKIQPTP